MSMPVAPMIQGPANQNETGADPECAWIDHKASQQECSRYERNRESVSCRQRKGRKPYETPAVAMKSQCHGEQPAHRRIEAMKCPEAGEREPGPELGGDRIHGALFPTYRGFRICGVRAGCSQSRFGSSRR